MNYYQLNLKDKIVKYVKMCLTCQFNVQNWIIFKKKVGKLWFLFIPNKHWEVCPMDFMMSLPPSKGFDLIMVGIVRFNKMVHFIPIVKITSTLKTRFSLHMFNITTFQKTLCLVKNQNSQVNFTMLCRKRWSWNSRWKKKIQPKLMGKPWKWT